MRLLRLFAIVLIYLLGCAGWGALGFLTEYRSHGASERLTGRVESLWGEPLVQEAPSVTIPMPGEEEPRAVAPVRCEAKVDLRADHRRKGLVWYPTYVCRFESAWTIANEEVEPRRLDVMFRFPTPGGTYDGFELRVGGARMQTPVDTRTGIRLGLDLAPGESREFRIAYTTRGLGEWRFRAAGRAGRVRDLDLAVRTDFERIDYPEGALSPMDVRVDADGAAMTWRASDLLTTQDIGVVVPEKLNPGPLASRITFFAPVCLLFFFVTVGTIGIVRGVDIHPMHYLFVTAGFFTFHLLLAYLVDHLDVHASFAIASAASVLLVTTYLRAALGSNYPSGISTAAQMFFLVLFSYSFFLEGTTGLTVAIGSVLTLAALMRVTARVDWCGVFSWRGSNASSPGLVEPA